MLRCNKMYLTRSNSKRETINQLTHNITTGYQLEIEKYTKELGEMIMTDLRRAAAPEEHFYKLLVEFLCDDRNPVLQVNVVYILLPVIAYTNNREMVIKYIEPSMMGKLLCSKDVNLRVQVLWFLRSIVLAFSNGPDIKIKPMIEETLESITFLINEHSPDGELRTKVK
ncbi:hypothetical protein POM88_012658 [Heracleum sosnowskyi]|uniref:Uncharacterized protein n=1 Tax=Heracleum sosnowskyi TaxID=360622 RepID=A0AAD8N2N8_9APIA|nr:hypothetical protein POM88_012658 [Heracleum sosnowskyi]